MSPRIENRIIDDIRKSVDIVDIVEYYLPLSKAGKNFKGLCPFHADKNPSLIVSREKQIFTCFSCGHTGGVFKFVEDIEKINFYDAVKKVCEIAGLKIPSELMNNDFVKPVDKYQRLYDLLDDVYSFYAYQLKVDSESLANKYLLKRALNDDDCKNFKIGYCPESGNESISYLKNKGYSDDEIISSGVGVDLGKGNIVDRLRGRVIFSITNSDGKIVAFSGRRIVDGQGEKYVNTPETVLFKKANILYNYHSALKTSHKDGYCYIVEGFMDAIALTKSNINSCVATMGTAFTDNHIKLLKQLRCEIRLLFDADDPGQIATNRCIESLINTSIPLKVVVPLANSKDIDELLQSEGADSVNKRINNLESITLYKINYFARGVNFHNHEDGKKFLTNCINFMSNITLDEIDLDYYSGIIGKLSGFSTSLIKKEYSKLSKERYYDYDDYKITYEQVSKHLSKYEQADHQIIQMMIENSMNILKYRSLNISLTNRNARILASLIVDKYLKGEIVSYASLFDSTSGEVTSLLGQIYQEQYPENSMELLAKIVGDDFLGKLDKEELERKLNETNDPIEQAKLGQQLLELKRKKK